MEIYYSLDFMNTHFPLSLVVLYVISLKMQFLNNSLTCIPKHLTYTVLPKTKLCIAELKKKTI